MMLSRAAITVLAALALSAPAFAADPRRDEQWGLEMVKAPGGLADVHGRRAPSWPSSTRACSSTTRTSAAERVTGFDFVGDDPIEPGDEDTDPTDGNGHGTHVTGHRRREPRQRRGDHRRRARRARAAATRPRRRRRGLRRRHDQGDRPCDRRRAPHVINLSLGDFAPAPVDPVRRPRLQGRARARGERRASSWSSPRATTSLPKCENPEVDGHRLRRLGRQSRAAAACSRATGRTST